MFPDKRTAPLHPSLPRRPIKRTAEAEPKRRPQTSVYSQVALETPGMTRRISRNNRAIQILVSRDGERAGHFLFAVEDLAALERAIAAAIAATGRHVETVGRISVPSGASIELSASAGTVGLRWQLPTGKLGKSTLLRGEELNALRRAIHDLKMTAAKAAETEIT